MKWATMTMVPGPRRVELNDVPDRAFHERDSLGISAATRAMDMDALAKEMVAVMHSDPERYRYIRNDIPYGDPPSGP